MPPVVAGIGALFGGISTALAAGGLLGVVANFGASLLLSGISRALMGKPDMSGMGVQSHTATVREPASPRQMVYGATRKGGAIVYLTTSGVYAYNDEITFKDFLQSYGKPPKRGTWMLHMIIVLAGHQVQKIGNIYFDGEHAFHENGVVTSRFYNKADVIKHYGYMGEAAFPGLDKWLPEWTNQHQLAGCAAIAVRLVFDAETYPNGIPNITVDMEGKNDILDPRTGSRGYTTNAALCVANYMENQTYGLGAQITNEDVGIRTEHLIEAANVCDEWVQTPEGGSERRYTCNGVIDTSQTPQSIIEGLLTAMAGKAIFKAGRWSIHAGAYRAPRLDLSLQDVIGGVQLVTRLSRSDNFNGVRGKFISPQNDWQPDDFPAVKSDVYLAEDNGVRSWRDIDLPFTTSAYAAQRIAKIELETARRQFSLQFDTNLKGLGVAPGDTVTFTHPRWAWDRKPFTVAGLNVEPAGDEQGVTPTLQLAETSPLVYDWNATEAQIYAAAPRSDLAGLWEIEAPGITSVREEMYINRSGDGALVRAVIDWSEAASPRVDRYILQYSQDGEAWLPVTETISTTAIHENAPVGVIYYRLQALGRLGQRSEWSVWQGELYGLSEPPVAINRLSLQTSGGLAVLKWDLPLDLDVRFGGRIQIRHAISPGSAWSNSISLDEVQGNTTIAVVPLMPGVYFVRPVDASGIYGPITTVFTDGAQALEFMDAGLLQADDEFSGTHDGTTSGDGILTLADTGNFDSIIDTDLLSSWDFPFGVSSEGTYTFASTLSWAAPRHVRLTAVVEMAPLVLTDDWDSRSGNVDDWLSWDAMIDVECDVQVQIRTTQDNPASSPIWSPWSRLDAGDHLARGVQARAILSSKSPDVAPIVSVLRVKAEQVA